MKKKVIVFADNYNPKGGGAEKIYFEFIEELKKTKKYEVYALAFGKEEINQKNTKVIKETKHTAVRFLWRIFFNPIIYRELRNHIKKINPDVIYTYNINKYTISLLKSFKGYKVIQRVNDYSFYSPTLWCIKQDGTPSKDGFQIKNFFEHKRNTNIILYLVLVYFFMKRKRLLKKRITKFIAATPQSKTYLLKQGFKNSLYIPFPVHIKNKTPNFNQMEKNSFLYAGQLQANKGVDLLLEEFAIALNKNKDLHLYYAGTGPLENSLKQRAKELGIQKNVTFLGWVNINDYIKKASCVILPSIILENCSIFIEEAMMQFRPAIVSNRGGNPYLVEHNKTGKVFDPLKKGEFAKCILEMANQKTCEKMGENAYKKIVQISKTYEEKKSSLFI